MGFPLSKLDIPDGFLSVNDSLIHVISVNFIYLCVIYAKMSQLFGFIIYMQILPKMLSEVRVMLCGHDKCYISKYPTSKILKKFVHTFAHAFCVSGCDKKQKERAMDWQTQITKEMHYYLYEV